MSFDRQFLELMPESVTYQQYSSISTGGYGTPSYGTAKTVRARIQAVRENARSDTSRDVVPVSFKLLLAPYSTAGTSDTVTITAMDKITLPSGFVVAGSSSPPIVRAYPVQDGSGFHHNEVWL